jgi:hypothetical protein
MTVSEIIRTEPRFSCFSTSGIWNLDQDEFRSREGISNASIKNNYQQRFENDIVTTIKMAVQPRKLDELEGTLLNSMETREANEPIFATAVPLNNDNTARLTPRVREPPIAPTLLTYDDSAPDVQAREVAQKTRFGSEKGRMQALEEKDQIQRASRKSSSFGLQEKHRVEIGQQIAKQRKREALDPPLNDVVSVDEFAMTDKSVCRENNRTTRPKVPGYQVSEYSVGEYEGSAYNILILKYILYHWLF